MNCSEVQRRLLELERLDRPPAEMRAHLADCAACRTAQRRLVGLERQVAALPIPPSTTRDDFLRRLRAGTPATNGRIVIPGPEERARRRERGLQKVALVTGLAAGLLLFALGLSALQWQPRSAPPRSRAPADPLLANLLKHNIRLAATASPRERVETLAALADDLAGESRSLAQTAAADELRVLTGLYERVLQDGILEQAKRLPKPDRAELLDGVADRLAQAGRTADELAANVTPAAAQPLRDLAAAARRADERLRALIQEAKT